MKRIFVLLMALGLISHLMSAQYSVEKAKYDYLDYEAMAGDPYSPGGASFASFLIPGLGQMITDEFGRGLGFLVADVAFLTMFNVGAQNMIEDMDNGGDGSGARGWCQLGLVGAIVINICAIVDASRVAKVKNMVVQDRRSETVMNINLSPYVTSSRCSSNMDAIGVTLSLRF